MDSTKDSETARLFKGVVSQEKPYDPLEDDIMIDDNQNILQPESTGPINLDELYKENDKIKMKNQEDLEGQTQEKQEARLKILENYMSSFSFELFRKEFDVNTADIISRLKHCIFPFTNKNLFDSKSHDLYGPLWILLTMTFSVSTFSAVFQKSDENHPQKEIVESSIIMISRVLCISILYLVLNSSMFYYSLDKAGATAKYCHIVSMYGYSFTIVPVAEFIILFPISYLRYIILIMAGVIS